MMGKGHPKGRKLTDGDNFQLRLNCSHIGLFDAQGNLNKTRAYEISDFIWSDENKEKEPDISIILKFVRSLDSNKITADRARKQAEKKKLAANRKKVKLARKARRRA